MYVKNFESGRRWLPGTIIKETGPVSFYVRLQDDGRQKHCHQDQLRTRVEDSGVPDTAETEATAGTEDIAGDEVPSLEGDGQSETTNTQPPAAEGDQPADPPAPAASSTASPPTRQYPQRIRETSRKVSTWYQHVTGFVLTLVCMYT